MKVVKQEVKYSNFEPEMIQPEKSVLQEFCNTMSKEEKKAKTYFDWQENRIYELIFAFQEELKSYFKNQEEFLLKSVNLIGHALIELGKDELQVENIEFVGTKEGVKNEIFNVNLKLSNKDNNSSVNTSKNQKSSSVELEEGESENELRFSSFLSQQKPILTIANQVFEQIKDVDHKGQKAIEIAAILINVAEKMSIVNSADAGFKLSGFVLEGETDEVKIKKLDDTVLEINATINKEKFQNIYKGSKRLN